MLFRIIYVCSDLKFNFRVSLVQFYLFTFNFFVVILKSFVLMSV